MTDRQARSNRARRQPAPQRRPRRRATRRSPRRRNPGGADSGSGRQDDDGRVSRRGAAKAAAPRPRKPRSPPAATADDTSPLLNRRAVDGPRVGRVLGRVGRRARRDRPLHVPERAQRAAAAVQGRLPDRVRHGRRRAVEGQVRHLDRQDRRTTTIVHASGFYVLITRLHAPGLHAELSGGGKQVQVSLPRQRLSPDAA